MTRPFDFVIRPAVPTDAAAASRIARRAKAHWGYPTAWLAQWADDLAISPELLGAHVGFAATDADGLIGICVLMREPDRTTLEHVWVWPEAQGRGVGRALVSHALRCARGDGVAIVQVQSDPFAEAFYLHLGATRVGAVPAPMPGAPDRVLPLLEFAL